MRNLKRALSLAVSTVMLIGMMAVGTSAASYADVDSADNVEAIEVMQAVSVMVGDENGNFNPDQNVTRAEMAVVMANLLDLQVEDFVGASIPFTDVPEWAHAYVAACYADGITGGISATEYGSNNSVTSVQAALMLLKALGYFQYSSDFGTDWQVATIREASSNDLFDGVTSSRNEALTRNEVAQIALNALEATMVEPDGTPGSVTTSDGTVVNLGSVTYNDRTSSNSQYAAISDDEGDDGRYTVELGEDLFDGDLEKNSSGSDDFQRPAHVWEYKGDEIGTYADDADEIYVVDDEGQSVLDILTDSDYMNYDDDDIANNVDVYINGEAADEDTTIYVGDIVEAFEDDDGVVTDVVVRRYTVAVVDSIDTDLSSTEERNGASVMITLADLDGNEIDDYYDDYDDDEDVLAGYNSAYEEGTVLAVAFYGNETPTSYVAGGQVLDSYVAETASGSITGYRDDSVTMDGTRYYYTGIAANEYSDNSFDFDEDYNVYLTEDGFVIGVDGSTGFSLSDLYYVTGVYRASGSYGGYDYYAQAVSLTDGVVEEIELDVDDEDNVLNDFNCDDDNDYFDTSVAGLYEFDDDIATAKYDDNDAIDDYTVIVGDLDESVDVDDTRINVGGRYYLDSSTQYLAVDDTGSDIEVSSATGGMGADTGSGTVYIIADGRDAVYVVYAGLNASAAADDVIYISDDDYDRVASDQYENADVYFVETGDNETIVFDDDYTAGRFYEVDDIDEDDVYSLNSVTDLEDTAIDEDTDDGAISSLTIPATTDDIDYVQNSALTTNDDNDAAIEGRTFDDVSLANATIIDTRGTSERNGDAYTREITSVSRLDAALDEASVTVDLYLMDGEIVFVAVTAVGDAPEEPEEPGETVISWTGDPEITDGTDGTIAVSGTLTNGEDCTTADLDGTLTVTVLSMNSVTGQYDVELVTEDITVTDGVISGSITVPAATYRVEWTLTIDGVTDDGYVAQLTVTQA